MRPSSKLAVVATHPIQYYAPWFAEMNTHLRAQVEVFYLWDFGVISRHDPGFGHGVRWDVDLLTGYSHRFVKNESSRPGTDHFHGLRNPSLVDELAAWEPNAILLFGYRYWSHLRVLTSWKLRRIPLLFRGDSHLLAEQLSPLSKKVKRLSLRLLFRRFAAFLPVGQANAVYFRRHGVNEKKLFPAPHAIDQGRFSAHERQTKEAAASWRRELEIPSGHRVILFAGKFEEKKRVEDLVRAFLAAQLPRATLLLVGSGPLGPKLRRLVGNHRAIRFAPFQNQSVMPRVYAAADLVVLPSAGPGESWGLVINEACCLGRAVITSDHVGCHPDLVRHGENGLVFPAGNVDALRDALIAALSDDVRLKAWGAASREIVRGFSYRAATDGLQRALDFILPPAAKENSPIRCLHLWIPELAGPGGIQAYSRNLLHACAGLLPHTAIHALVKNGPIESSVAPIRVRARTAAGIPEAWRRSGYAALLVYTLLTRRPDLVIITHLHFAPIARWLRRWIRFRYWVVVHGIEAWAALSPSQKRALKGAEKILPVSAYTAQRLRIVLGAATAPMEQLPNMVDETRFIPGPKPPHLLRRYGLTEEHQILLTVARLDPRQRYKGYDLVLDALALLRGHTPQLRYLIAGRGQDSARIRRRVREMGLEAQVILTGFLPERDLCDHYNLCDLFVMPSQAEGFGIVFLEALACGRGVVAGNADGSAEPLLQGALGTLVNPHDARQLADTLINLLPPTLSADASFLRRTTIRNFGTDAFRERLRELLT